jgi:hypothetical protein
MVLGPVNVVVTVPCVLFCRQNVISTRQSFCSAAQVSECMCGFVVSERNTGPMAPSGTFSAPHTRQPHVVLLSELTRTFLHIFISFLRVRLSTEVKQGFAAKQNECGICCYLWTPHEGTSSQSQSCSATKLCPTAVLLNTC